MADTEPLKYLWIVEWHNPFAQENNRGLLFYRLTVLPGVKPEDFEAFVKNEAFPAVGKILTRAIQYRAAVSHQRRRDDSARRAGQSSSGGHGQAVRGSCDAQTGRQFHRGLAEGWDSRHGDGLGGYRAGGWRAAGCSSCANSRARDFWRGLRRTPRSSSTDWNPKPLAPDVARHTWKKRRRFESRLRPASPTRPARKIRSSPASTETRARRRSPLLYAARSARPIRRGEEWTTCGFSSR